MANKSVLQRIRMTRNGKLIKRKMGLNHFRAKKNSRQLKRKKDNMVSSVDVRMFKRYL